MKRGQADNMWIAILDFLTSCYRIDFANTNRLWILNRRGEMQKHNAMSAPFNT
jgi:hypothetical protein